MKIVCIAGPSFESAQAQIENNRDLADAFEWRIDLWEPTTPSKLLQLKALGKKPIVVALRCKEIPIFLQELNPEYIDIDISFADALLNKIKDSLPATKLIISLHHYEAMPKDLDGELRKLFSYKTWGCKLACFAHSSIDALRLLQFSQKHPNLAAIAMGEIGKFTRVISTAFSAPLSYFAANDTSSTAPGQIAIQDAIKIYNLRKYANKPALYGLIGDPIDKSPSHMTHNRYFDAYKKNALYVKMAVRKEELGSFLAAAKDVGFKGLSVTIPHKEAVIDYLDEIDPQAAMMGAVNTVCFHEGKLIGYNTDGMGALNVLLRHLVIKDQKVVILGGGGVARAIAFALCGEGASVTIISRTPEKLYSLQNSISCSLAHRDELDLLVKECTLLINCAPPEAYSLPQTLPKTATVFETNMNMNETALSKAAFKNGNLVISGLELFFAQAKLQMERFLLV